MKRKTTIQIKPLSVNQAWQGRRYKTKEYLLYEKKVLLLLPKMKVPKGKKLKVKFEFGISSKNADWDNPIKPIQDILQKKYGFNDKMVYKAKIIKKDVPKGKEYITFEIKEI